MHQVCPINRNLMAYNYILKASSMPHSQKYDGIQIFFKCINYAPFTGIWWYTTIFWRHKVCPFHRNMMTYTYLLRASSMPHSQESGSIQISSEGNKHVSFTGIWWHTDIFWRYKVCTIHINLMAYIYILNASSMPHSQEFDGIQLSVEGIKYASYTEIW